MAGVATLLIWILPLIYGRPANLEMRIGLVSNPIYMIRQWISFINIFFILLAIWGITLKKFPSNPGSSSVGMLFFLIYGVVELFGRSTMIFVREYRWAARLQTESEPAVREGLIQNIQNFNTIWGGFFILLLVCFILGSFCLGTATRRGVKLERWVSLFLYSASVLALITLLALCTRSPFIRQVARWGYLFIQPTSRFLIGLWLWRSAIEKE